MPLLLRYQHLKGEKIVGGCSLSGFEDWIELRSLEFEGGRKVAMTHDGSGLRGENLPFLTEVVVTKRCDRSSPLLFLAALQGGEGDIEVVLSAGTVGESRIAFVFRTARIATYRIQLEDSKEVERLAIVYASFDMTYRERSEVGNETTNVSVAYDWSAKR